MITQDDGEREGVWLKMTSSFSTTSKIYSVYMQKVSKRAFVKDTAVIFLMAWEQNNFHCQLWF